MRTQLLFLTLLVWFCPPSAGASEIRALLKPEVYRKVTQGTDVISHARLGKAGADGMREYRFYAVMKARATPKDTSRRIQKFEGYPRWISYVDKADWKPESHTLQLEGGIWDFKLRSQVKIGNPRPHEMTYQVIGGHLMGLKGRVLFEAVNDRESLIYLSGERRAAEWPPAFVMERGAEMVLSFAGRKLRGSVLQNADE